MNIRTLISPIALAAALSISGGAVAQTTVGGWDVSEEDLPKVEAHCMSLAAQATESLTSTDGDDDDDDGDDDNPENATDSDPASEDGDASDLDNALTDADLDTITLEQCREAGLAEEGRIVAQ